MAAYQELLKYAKDAEYPLSSQECALLRQTLKDYEGDSLVAGMLLAGWLEEWSNLK